MKENEKLDIYFDRSKEYERQRKKLQEADISEADRKAIIGFENFIFSQGSCKLRVAKLLSQLRKICIWKKEKSINEPLCAFTRKELIVMISHINQIVRLSEVTKADYRRGLKQFYKWYREEDKRLYSANRKLQEETRRFYNFVDKELKITYKHKQANPNTIITVSTICLIFNRTLSFTNKLTSLFLES